MKLAAKGDPGFILSSVNQFSILIDRLMDLCRTHYRTEKKIEVEESEEIPLFELHPLIPMYEEDQEEPKQIASTDTDSGKRVLDTHRAIIQVFVTAMRDKKWSVNDKQSDQFAELLHVSLASGRNTFVVAVSSDKRTSADAGLDASEQMTKRQKGPANSSSIDPEVSGQLDIVDEEGEEGEEVGEIEEDEPEEEEAEAEFEAAE